MKIGCHFLKIRALADRRSTAARTRANRNSMEKSLDLYSRSQLKRRHLPEDRISSLPDEIILIILSFLTLKDMLKTSILSSRWLNLWVNTPVLDFQGPSSDGLRWYDDSSKRKRFYDDNNNFVERVDHVLRQYKGHYLKEFRIGMNHMKGHQKDIDRWLEFALTRKVEILELNFYVSARWENHLHYVLPQNRFLQFELKCLKLLSLKHVDVTGEAINSFLLSCPFIERLEVVCSRALVNLVISYPTLSLKYLHIKYCFQLKVLSISNFNLVSLDISYGALRDLTLRDLPMLVELSIVGYSTNLRRIVSQNASCLPLIEALTLIAYSLKDVTVLSNLLQLTKLKRLVIQVGVEFDESLIALFSIVNSCHHLEEFVLEMLWYEPKRISRTMREVERLSSKSKSLKVFEFNGYYGRVSDVEFIMHVVENATGLEKIIIKTCNFRERMYSRCPDHSSEKEARSIALKQLEYLRESKNIPPHVDVLIP